MQSRQILHLLIYNKLAKGKGQRILFKLKSVRNQSSLYGANQICGFDIICAFINRKHILWTSKYSRNLYKQLIDKLFYVVITTCLVFKAVLY